MMKIQRSSDRGRGHAGGSRRLTPPELHEQQREEGNMFADYRAYNGPARRRGVVLILVLGMLALLALIGVTFATFASQSRISARYFAQSASIPEAGDVMDYALSQLINDTDNPLSAIRGHSLKRDMYGNDASTNGLLTSTVNGRLLLTSSVNADTFVTNIPFDGSTSFVGWTLRIAPTAYGFDPSGNPVTVSGTQPTMQSFMVLADAADTSGNFHQLQLSPTDTATKVVNITDSSKPVSALVQPADAVTNSFPFILDGRYRFAFNGPGVGGALGATAAQFGNYRFNGSLLTNPSADTVGRGLPGTVGLDEDYDACDLENWFLAIQSADGKVVVPSFHRPGILFAPPPPTAPNPNRFSDWSYSILDWATTGDATLKAQIAQSMAKILRPRSVDHGPNNPFSNGVEKPNLLGTNVAPTYDVDNDGDGTTDSVWLDLGYAPRRNAQGKLYKPLFAFMVVGLNGRIPLNTAGNLAGRDDNGAPLAGHTTHLGDSVSEVDPTYALQNALANANLPNPATGNPYGQNDDSGTDVRTIQLQNLLAGTRPIPPEILGVNPVLFTLSGLPVSGSGFTGTAQFGDMNHAPIGTDALGNVLRYYMPNSIVDTSDIDTSGAVVTDPATANVARIAATPNPIPGRWGEASSISGLNTALSPLLARAYNNPARAGYSQGNRDVDDDNLNAFDPYPSASRQGELGDADFYDSSASPILPVERIRRFVTPIDLDGSGRVGQWNSSSGSAGADPFGRVTFLSYFRPPGLPAKIDPASGLLSFYVDPGDNGKSAVDQTNNFLHGYDFYRIPATATANPSAQRLGGSPANVPSDGSGNPTAASGLTLPTYDSKVNGGLRTDGQNDADEMNLYSTSRNDQPYGPSDLEWLYRAQDVDGYSLSSRLSQLAPISFTNPVDGQRRRRLFSTESWELNNYVWTNDNPQGGYANNSRNQRNDNAGFASVKSNTTALNAIWGTNDPLGTGPLYYDRSTAHRNRKININYPLPVSNDPDEPVRKKWITDAYYMLKAVLPPKAIDTPEELAQLSQFLVNVIDFRDPDATMTHFKNPDIYLQPGTTTASAKLVVAGSTGYSLDQYGMEYSPVAISEVLAYSYKRKATSAGMSTATQTNRFFIELVNTLTHPDFTPSGFGTDPYLLDLGGNKVAPPLSTTNPYDNGCWDLVFTDDTPQARPDPFRGQLQPTAGVGIYGLTPLSSISLDNNVSPTLTPLAVNSRVAYNSASSPTSTLTNFPPTNYYYVLGSKPATTSNTANDTSEAPAPGIAATQPLKPAYDPVDQTAPPTGSTVVNAGVIPSAPNTPSVPAAYPGKLTQPTTGTGKYYWVCLRRPANPFAPVSANNPMVVVDSMRFVYTEGGGTAFTDSSGDHVTTGTNAHYSSQRLQPYRGGHAVQAPEGGFDWRYGYSEQIVAPTSATGGFTGTYGTSASQATGSQGPNITTQIYHTLKEQNDPNNYEEPWDYFPFNDRDFTSVAELLLVPGTAPGLFTKQFVELPVTQANITYLCNTAYDTSGAPASLTARPTFASGTASQPFANYSGMTISSAKSYPYLVDKFFYSASDAESFGAAANLVDSQTSAGWYKMFDLFEVPSQSMGAYGTVAQGSNFDWYRQDTRPGLINPNLIIDEEAFLSVFGKQNSSYAQQLLNFTAAPAPPSLVTSLTWPENTGDPTVVNAMPVTSPGYIDGTTSVLKHSFVQFLRLRHGGSGNLFGFGTGAVGTPYAAERPFRSLSFPDINQTVMRPASLPPATTTPTVNPSGTTSQTAYLGAAGATYQGDPGLKNSLLYPGYATGAGPTGTARILPPAIPGRRLFQPPDLSTPESGATTLSNAGVAGDSFINDPLETGSLVATSPPNLFKDEAKLGNADTAGIKDTTRHPYFRSEMLQKVMNLTTVRTHQYAVWITVGFFEVTRQGNPDLVDSAPPLAYDMLGREIGLNGKIVRYRGFYIVDRTKATGFSPVNPGDYHNCVVYGHVIQ